MTQSALRVKNKLIRRYGAGTLPHSFALGAATVVLLVKGETLYIHTLHVAKDARGSGHGSRALKQVIKEADASGVVLRLRVLPYDGDRSFKRLFAWYSQYGFYRTIGNFMRRNPRRVK